MAWRIDEAVIRGEIDNRIRGRITGRIWLSGLGEPMELELAGNACGDLAGRRLEFVNPAPKPQSLEGVALRQTGVIGDCTASREVRVPDIPMEQIGEYYAARKPFPWHWGNSLYLEWVSAQNGRLVIESAAFTLKIDSEVAWEMTAAEDESQRRANAEAMGNFMSRLADATPAAEEAPESEAEPAPEWNGKPLTEAEAEKMHDDSDRFADRISARLEREGADNYEKILREELERRREERGDAPLTPEEEAKRTEWVDEMNRAAAEAAANPDAELDAELDQTHPLADRAFELTTRLMKEPEERGWVPKDANSEYPVIDLVSSVMKASAKLAGALNGSWPPEVDVCANHIVRLKRARDFLDHALLSAECCAQQNLVDSSWLADTQREINAIGHECDLILADLRAKLERGFD